jgi:sulfur carrier protein
MMAASVRVNGEDRPFEAISVQELLVRLGVNGQGRGAAVAINGAVVPRREWETRHLDAGDDVEVVRPFAGG